MTDPIAVTFPVYNRPDYLRQVLHAWSLVRGVENALFEFHCEPGCDENVDLCKAVSFAQADVYVNPVLLGHAWNVHKSMTHAFLGKATYAIQAVDDFIPSEDLLELHAWHQGGYERDMSVLTLRSGTDVSHGPDLGAVWRTQLTGILTGWHAWKWDHVARYWRMGTANWWAWMNERWAQKSHLDVLAPSVSRALDIGATGSDGEPDPIASTGSFVQAVPVQEYREVTGQRERAVGFTRYIEERSRGEQ